jgi:transcriptional regulator with PAS, ATPase and Fis domain
LLDRFITALSASSGPGNVRQLRHVLERLVATAAEGETITAADIYKALPAATLTEATSQVPIVFHDSDSLDDFLDRTMLGLYDQLLAKTGNHSQAARLLRTDRVSLYERVERARRRILNGTT